jgi:hypothetical protein
MTVTTCRKPRFEGAETCIPTKNLGQSISSDQSRRGLYDGKIGTARPLPTSDEVVGPSEPLSFPSSPRHRSHTQGAISAFFSASSFLATLFSLILNSFSRSRINLSRSFSFLAMASILMFSSCSFIFRDSSRSSKSVLGKFDALEVCFGTC